MDVSSYCGQQVGRPSAMSSSIPESVERYKMRIEPVIDGVEGTFTKTVRWMQPQ